MGYVIMYGMGVASIADQIHKSVEEAQEILDLFYTEFPSVKDWMDGVHQKAYKVGYAEDLWGRRRQLPDIQLPPYEIKVKGDNGDNSSFNPFFNVKGIIKKEENPLIAKYKKLLESVRTRRDSDNIKNQALKEGIEIINNQGFIAEAERQSVNACIQGGAASMSKKAIIALYNDEEMKKLGFRLLIMVHDELIGECPIENQEKALERLSYLMATAGKPEVDLPMKCDAVAFSHWYEDEYTAMVCKEFDKLKENGMSNEQIIDELMSIHSELLIDELIGFLKEKLSA